jgi:hypothetical protein
LSDGAPKVAVVVTTLSFPFAWRTWFGFFWLAIVVWS